MSNIGSLEILNKEINNQEKFKDIKGKVNLIKFKDRLHLNNVEFSYDNRQSNVLKNISLTIRANTSIALVGKSDLENLLSQIL